MPASPLGDGVGDQVVPRLAGLHDEPRRRSRSIAAGADGDDVARPALVGGDDVRPAAEQQQRPAGLVGLAHGGDQLGGVRDLDQPVGRARRRRGW